jgi:hypothetical protein
MLRPMLVTALCSLVLAASPVRVLALELEPVGVDTSLARAVDPVLLAAAASVDGVELVSQGEMKKMADLEATKADLGCDTSSCLAELAGAMGARFVLFGSVSRLGEQTTVALSLFDSQSASVTRDLVAVSDVGHLPKELPAHVRGLLAKGAGLAVADEPAPGAPSPGPSVSFIAGVGAAAVGAAALVGGGAWAVVAEGTIQDVNEAGAVKKDAQGQGPVVIRGSHFEGFPCAGVVGADNNALSLDLGTGSQPGNNVFSGNGTDLLVDLNNPSSAPTVAALGNTWSANPPVCGEDIAVCQQGTSVQLEGTLVCSGPVGSCPP